MRLPLLALIVLASSSAASAQGLTAGRYHDLCADRTSASWQEIGQWLCPSYLRGLIEGVTLQAIQNAGSVEGARHLRVFCEPERSTADAAIGIVARFIEAHPETRSVPIASIAYQAFADAWPCLSAAPR